MAYTLKLNIYNFSLYRITNTIERYVRGEIRKKYETEADATPFNSFLVNLDPIVNRDSYLPVLFQSVVDFFDSRFKINYEGPVPPSSVFSLCRRNMLRQEALKA